jgi:hypothetical protein
VTDHDAQITMLDCVDFHRKRNSKRYWFAAEPACERVILSEFKLAIVERRMRNPVKTFPMIKVNEHVRIADFYIVLGEVPGNVIVLLQIRSRGEESYLKFLYPTYAEFPSHCLT